MTNEEKIVRAIDRAVDGHRAALTPWEHDFLVSLLKTYRGRRALSVKQKSVALPIVKRLKIPMDY